VIASRLRRDDEAYSHYLRTARLDLDDYNAEVHEGLHITSMAGTWLSVVEGFGGFRVREGVPCFDGRLPKQWKELAFQIFFRERLIAVELNEKGTRVRLVTGDSIDIKIMGELQTLKSAQ
jgi:maltose phosphorylase